MRIEEKELEKIDHYQDLKVEVKKIWNCRSVSGCLDALGNVFMSRARHEHIMIIIIITVY